jgi:signal transduction histidine kinase
MPKGGPLTVKSKRTGNYAVVTISDRGVGIAPELQHKIFQLYYTTKAKGNGIGLANAFRTIQLHNGRIEFESTRDVGTKFKIYLPEV